MCSFQDVFFNSLDWLEQTPISNTMPHATYKPVWRRAKEDVSV